MSDRKLFEERIETLRNLDPKTEAFMRLYMLTSIMSAIHDWGVIDPMITKEVQI